MLFCKTSQASPPYKSIAYSLVSFIFGLRRVSLAEYLLVLRALFPLLLQMVKCTTATILTVCIQRWVTTRTTGNGHSVSPLWCFYWRWLPTCTVSELSVCVKTTCFRYVFWTCVVITLCFELRCIQLSLRTLGNMWRWLINQYDLSLLLVGLKSFMISRHLGFGKLFASTEDFLT
jgi:hypothetical protein